MIRCIVFEQQMSRGIPVPGSAGGHISTGTHRPTINISPMNVSSFAGPGVHRETQLGLRTRVRNSSNSHLINTLGPQSPPLYPPWRNFQALESLRPVSSQRKNPTNLELGVPIS